MASRKCRQCGVRLPPPTGGPGRPQELCNRCGAARGKIIRPIWDAAPGSILAAVDTEFPDPDWSVAAARRIAATMDACSNADAGAFVLLAKGLDRAIAAAKHYRNERETGRSMSSASAGSTGRGSRSSRLYLEMILVG